MLLFNYFKLTTKSTAIYRIFTLLLLQILDSAFRALNIFILICKIIIAAITITLWFKSRKIEIHYLTLGCL